MTAIELIWKCGDSWRGLTDEIAGLDAITIVSENGTVRLFDLVNRRQKRVPLAHAMCPTANGSRWKACR